MRVVLLMIVSFFVLFTPLKASCAHILVVYRQDIQAYKRLVNTFKNAGKFELLECQLNNSCSIQEETFDFIVALGDSAVRYSHRFKKPLIAFFISDYSLAYSCPSQKCLYYFLFPSAKQILVELAKIIPSKTKVAILCSANSLSWIDQSVRGFPFDITVETISSSEILTNLRKIFRKDYQIIILAPDLLFLQKKVLREIVKLSYTAKKLIVGFSSQMLDLGFPLVITYDYEQIYSLIPQAVENFEKEKYISFPISVFVNKKVLNLFQIKSKLLNDKSKIQQK